MRRHVDPHLGNGIAACRVAWEPEAVTITADEALATGSPGRPPEARDGAVAWLRELLAAEPVPVATVRAEARAAGIAWRTVERARTAMRIAVKRIGEPGVRGGGE